MTPRHPATAILVTAIVVVIGVVLAVAAASLVAQTADTLTTRMEEYRP